MCTAQAVYRESAKSWKADIQPLYRPLPSAREVELYQISCAVETALRFMKAAYCFCTQHGWNRGVLFIMMLHPVFCRVEYFYFLYKIFRKG